LQVAAIYNFDSYDRLPQIQQPTLVLTGKEDVLIPPDNSRVLARHIPGAKLVEYDKAGHLFFIEKAEQVNQQLVEFFDEANSLPG
jgi:3-oxoadipate enol-lactonase